eukprot:g2852.t1
MKSEEKDAQEWHQLLVEAMAGKQRSLVVLDDPWMPEQVRFLNPIDGLHTEKHRLLVTTRIRDLVPKATRIELPLMGKDEAVALLLDLANVEEARYLKEHPESTWPPEAAYTIAAECGLLPVTLTIAAQVVRSWGEGWETAVLPLLREQEGSGQSGTSTVEERVIGAGLQALEKNEDGPAVKKLFYAFAATHEDFVHPIAVVELLWQSCCASESEKQQSSLAARLKVRQRTQLLVDHSLLLGSSSEGVHLHDIVLQYLRKQLSTEELRAEHQKIVEGMVATAERRLKTTGRGLLDTGTIDRPFDGEEVDWYCCTLASWHMQHALEASIQKVESERLRGWLLLEDEVLFEQATITMGVEGLKALATECASNGALFPAVKAKLGLANLRQGELLISAALLKEALTLLEQMPIRTSESYQMEWIILARYSWFMSLSDSSGDERARVKAQQEKLGKDQPSVRRDPVALYNMRNYLEFYIPAISPFSGEDIFEAHAWVTQPQWAGRETAHLFPFQAKLWRGCKLAELTDAHEFQERYSKWPTLVGMRQGASPADAHVNLGFCNTLPPPELPMHLRGV